MSLSPNRTPSPEHTLLLYTMLESVGDGVVAADASGKFLLFNPAAEHILGVGRTDLGPEQWAEHYKVYRPDGVTPHPTEELPLVRAMRGEVVDGVELCIRRPDPSKPVWLTISARPLPDGGGIVVFHDATTRKLADLKIRRLNAELEARVEERTADLEQANRELALKNQDLEMFVYSVSHDLRSPLVNLQGFSKELDLALHELRTLFAGNNVAPAVRSQAAKVLDDDVAMSLRYIHAAVTRLSDIIDALLRLSRAGRVEYQWQSVDLDSIVQRIVDSLHGTIAERGATVTIGKLPPARGDATALEQVFANLIGNALNYLDATRPGVVEIGVQPDDGADMQTFFVRDNGLGIPDAYLPKLFQIFQRLHPSAAKGEGVGLVLVKRIVERHGGRVWVESKHGIGSTFYVTLPAVLRESHYSGGHHVE